MSKYRYAIIVPNYNNDHGNFNGKTYLAKCIESILNQTYKNFKLIIVDDMSDDTSMKTLKEYKKLDNRIVLIRNMRKRFNGGSRNVGIEYALEHCIFQYFCFLDSDDWWRDENVLTNIDSQLDNHELMTLGVLMYKGKKGFIQPKNNKSNTYEDLWSFNGKVWCTAWSKVIRRDKIKYFNESTLMEDRVWNYRTMDDIDFNKTTNLARSVYVWNQVNNNRVSQSKSDMWNNSTWNHIGNCKQFMCEIKHKEMLPIIENRIEQCIKDLMKGDYYQG